MLAAVSCVSAALRVHQHTLLKTVDRVSKGYWLQMCTFAPKLNQRPLSEEWAGSVIERSEAWQARRDQKLHEAREHDADKDLEGCTFRYAQAVPEAETAVDTVMAAV